jgi:hypothetical protein
MKEEANLKIEKFLKGKTLKVECYGTVWETVFSTNYYTNGNRIFIELREDGQSFANLTVNIPEVPLNDYEIIIKNWSGNEEMAEAALLSGLFKDTGRRVATGHVQAPIWKVMCEEG